MVSAVSHARRALIGPPGWRFFSFWLALAITNLGTWAGVVALQLQILDMTGDQAYVSAVVVAEFLPAVILGTVLGHLLDRLPPRTGLVACEFIAAAAWALMVTTGRAGTIVALALICGVTTGIFRIVSSVVVPMLVDDHELDAANGAILSAQTLTNVAGAALGGLLVALTSAHDVLLLNAFTFVISGALLLLFSRVPRSAPKSPDAPARGSRSWLAGSVVGARRCLATPMLRMVMFSLPVASLALGVVIAGSVPILRDTYGASDFQTGVILALDALGIAIGGASLRGRRTGYLTGLALLAIGWGGFGIAPNLLIAAPLAVIGGIGNGIVIVRFRTMMQRETPPHERASTIGFAYAVTFSLVVVGQIAVVPLTNALGQRATFTAAGTVFALGGLVAALCWPSTAVAPAPAPVPLEVVPETSPVHAR
jgi:MFS family permease